MLRYLIALTLAVFGCGFTAVFYRPLNTYFNHELLAIFGDSFLALRQSIQHSIPLSNILIYNVPGALWIFGLSLLGWRLHLGHKRTYFSLFYLAIAIGQLVELVQALGWTDGTFDWLDILWNFIGFTFALLFCKMMPDDWRATPGYWRYILYFLVFFAAFGVDVLA